jgi:5-methylcytosine-specific restriction protein A
VERGRCDAHRYSAPAHQRKPGEQRFYDTRLWRSKIRPRKLARTPCCEACAERGETVVATCVDHRNGNPLDNRDDNLVALCDACHSRKTVEHDGGFGRPRTPGGL